MMDLFNVWLMSVAAVLLLLTLLWLLSVALRNVSIVDIAWGPGFAVLGALEGLWGGGGGERGTLVQVLVTVWAARLGLHLLVRNAGKGEDPRYAAFRAQTGPSYWWKSLGTVFWLQGGLMGIISLPLLFTRTAPAGSPGVLAWMGAAVFAVGLLFETVGDLQLTGFKRDPGNRGKVMDRGLWRYTRHPNYFGDAVVWWGLFIIALETPWGFVTAVGPLLMTVLLMRVSGVSLLERSLKKSKPGYAEYVARTNAFVPWFPRPPSK